MVTKHKAENRYCAPCQCTTSHSVEGERYECLRCGRVKRMVRAGVNLPVRWNINRGQVAAVETFAD